MKNKKRELTIIFVITITLLLYFSGYSIGKAHQSVTIQANGKIAEPILVVENNKVLEVSGKNETESYNFKVKNTKEDGKINEVDLEYNIEIISNTEESISFELYKNNEKVLLENNKTANMKMKKGELQEDTYELKIIYDKTKNKSNTQDIIDDVQIKVHSEQIGNGGTN